jgi:LAS superfamily LD-carboxypeptidase LdcB
MKLRVTFDFEFLDNLSETEKENLIYIIEGWSEHEGGAFLEIPGGFKQVLLSHKFIEDKE